MTNISKIITKFASALVCATAFSDIHCAEEFNTDGTKKDGRRASSDFSAADAANAVKKSGSGVKDRSAAFKNDNSPNKPNFVTPSQLLKAQLEEERRKAELSLKEKDEESRQARLVATTLAAQDARDAIKTEVTVVLLEAALQKASDDVTRLTTEYNKYTYGSHLLAAGRAVYRKQEEAIQKAKQLQGELENVRKTAEEKKTIAAKSSNLLPKDWNADLERESIMKELSEAFDILSVSGIPVAMAVENTNSK